MSGASSNCSRLCRLINDSLHQYTVNHTTLSHSTSQAFISDQNFFNFLVFFFFFIISPTLNYDVLQEPEAVDSLTKQKEKDILIALSKLLKQIQLWTPKLDAYSHNVLFSLSHKQ
jgi:hypothetical protein